MKINPKHYLLIVLAIASIGLSGFGYWYLYNKIISQAEGEYNALQEYQIEVIKKQNEQDLVKVYADTLSDRNKLSSYFITEDKIIGFIESVEAVGDYSKTDVTLSAINTDDFNNLEKGNSGHLKTHIDIKGDWSNVMKALILIENMPYSISINNMNLLFASGKWSMAFDIEVLTIK